MRSQATKLAAHTHQQVFHLPPRLCKLQRRVCYNVTHAPAGRSSPASQPPPASMCAPLSAVFSHYWTLMEVLTLLDADGSSHTIGR